MARQKNSHTHVEQGSLIHVKFDFEEALNAKKGILRLQMATLKVMKSVERYKELRMREIGLKESLAKKIKNTKASLKHLKTLLPKAEIPKIARKSNSSPNAKSHNIAKKSHAASGRASEIESELLEIQKRLDLLQSQHV